MFAVGHMALAYILGKGSSISLRTKLNIPILLVLAILPDIDIIYDFITGSEIHRGPTHSLVIATIVFIPIFLKYRKEAFPYFLALISHPLIGDFFIGGNVQLFWPLSSNQYGLQKFGPYITIYNPINITLEISLFVISTLVMYKLGDLKVFFAGDKTNLVLIIPIATVLLPTTVGYPFKNSLLITEPILAAAHLFYLVLFSIAIARTVGSMKKKSSIARKRLPIS